MVDGESNENEWIALFRQKCNYMQSWKPESTPSKNRDRLELYAYHKQAVHGDAPATFPASSSLSNSAAAVDRAKYHAWRGKQGISKADAMKLYCQEADRHIRVYGRASHASLTPMNTPGTSNQRGVEDSQQPRGLAAIPLLCAAASEPRQAYLRRLSQTSLQQAWWRRQEPLTATPGTVLALPEHSLLGVATLVEYISLAVQQSSDSTPRLLSLLPAAVVQSFLWPVHNSFLALWMGFILVTTAWGAAIALVQTVVLGSRRTGLSLQAIWRDQVQFVAQSLRTLTEQHQPLTARVMGLLLLPLSLLIQFAGILTSTEDSEVGDVGNANSMILLGTSFLFCGTLVCTWWYWYLFLPVLVIFWLAIALVAGQCFALIEQVGV